MTPMLMSVAEPEFIPWIEESEEEAQELVRSLLDILRRTVDAAPIWVQHEFSQRAENVLKRNRLLTWPDLHRAIDNRCVPGGGALVLKEFADAVFARKWGGRAV
jgi:Cft2 family RNA processing exonuclease